MINSQFPQTVDKLIYFSDVDIGGIQDANVYRNYFIDGTSEKTENVEYDKANAYLQTHDNINGYFSKLFNLLFSRLKATQQFLIDVAKEYLSAYGLTHDEAMNYTYISEDNCWLDIALNDEKEDPDYTGNRNVRVNLNAYKSSVGI